MKITTITLAAGLVLAACGVEVAEPGEDPVFTTQPPATIQQQTEPASDLTPAQQNAVRSAQAYLDLAGFSRAGLIDQLTFEQYSATDAAAAVDSLDVDWNEEAAESAAAYLTLSGFSCEGLIDQLSSEFGEGFTVEQATFGATTAGAC